MRYTETLLINEYPSLFFFFLSGGEGCGDGVGEK